VGNLKGLPFFIDRAKGVGAMLRKKVKKRLYSHCIGEFAASIVFIFVLFQLKRHLHLDIDFIIIYPFSILIFILMQGSYYWFYCLRRLNKKQVNANRFVRVYKALRKFDLLLIVLFPLIVICSCLGGWQLTLVKISLASFIFVFGVAEYINYYYVQLSYNNLDNIVSLIKLKNLKKSALNKELAK
jgi:hypothetical protein